MDAFWGKLKEKMNKKTGIGLGHLACDLWVGGGGVGSITSMDTFKLRGRMAANVSKELIGLLLCLSISF